VEHTEIKEKKPFLTDLVKLIESLRGPHGCPWDRKQTPRSMVVYLIEEIYELVDAIETDNMDEICEELGDVLFHVFFLARMFQEAGFFSVDDVARDITRKMTRRHPHVFGTDVVNSTDEVVQNWQRIKLSEKNKAKKESILDTIPTKLPALMRAYMISDRTSKAGFEHKAILGHLNETVKHLTASKSTLPDSEKEPAEQQLGDVLFEIVNFARGAGIHPETALSGSVKRFEERFKRMEKRIRESGKKIQDISQDEKDRIWAGTDS
jgi:tetrapyrrole methylase family protein/MazG family protein